MNTTDIETKTEIKIEIETTTISTVILKTTFAIDQKFEWNYLSNFFDLLICGVGVDLVLICGIGVKRRKENNGVDCVVGAKRREENGSISVD